MARQILLVGTVVIQSLSGFELQDVTVTRYGPPTLDGRPATPYETNNNENEPILVEEAQTKPPDLPFCESRQYPVQQQHRLCLGDKHVVVGTSRSFSNECGPHCRPSCITLMLDLDSVSCYETNDCHFLPLQHCESPCPLETATCERKAHKHSCDEVDSHWPVLKPLEKVDCGKDCKRREFFEYCHASREECDDCQDPTSCRLVVEPLRAHTTFVVSTKLRGCCWSQRVDLYFPEDCPVCHECELLQLGDRIGNLEVIGFGHGRQGESICSSCDAEGMLQPNRKLSCRYLDECVDSVDCRTGESLHLPAFEDNFCSFDPEASFFAAWSPQSDLPSDLPSDMPSVMPELYAAPEENKPDASAIEQAPPPPSNGGVRSWLVITAPLGGAICFVALLIFVGITRISRTRRTSTEGIVYIQPIDHNHVNRMIYAADGDDTLPEEYVVEFDHDDDTLSNSMLTLEYSRRNAVRRFLRRKIAAAQLQQAQRAQSTTLVETPEQNEVEMIHTCGVFGS